MRRCRCATISGRRSVTIGPSYLLCGDHRFGAWPRMPIEASRCYFSTILPVWIANICMRLTSLSRFHIALRGLRRNRNYHSICVARFMGAALNDDLEDRRVALFIGIEDRRRLGGSDYQALDGRPQELPPVFATRCAGDDLSAARGIIFSSLVGAGLLALVIWNF
jgi:hypothetical protein